MGPAIELDGVSVLRRGERDELKPVVHDLSLAIATGERFALLGANGAGKSSLLLALVGALRFRGTIRVLGSEPRGSSLRSVRQRVGFVFAEPSDQLFCDSVHAEIRFGLEQRGPPAATIDDRVRAALATVQLQHAEQRHPTRLSLGERRRLALATALVLEPAVLIVDEPTANLDPRARALMLDVLANLRSTLVFATHDLDAVRRLGARVLLLSMGRALADGPADSVLDDRALLEDSGLAVPEG